MIVSTISSAPPESARSFANIAPNAIRMAGAGGGGSKSVGERLQHIRDRLAGHDSDGQSTADQPEEGTDLRDGDEDDDHRDAGKRREDQLSAAATGSGSSLSTANTAMVTAFVSARRSSGRRRCSGRRRRLRRRHRRFRRSTGRCRSRTLAHRRPVVRGSRTGMPATMSA